MSFKSGWEEQLAGIVEREVKHQDCLSHPGKSCEEFDAYIQAALGYEVYPHILRQLHKPNLGARQR